MKRIMIFWAALLVLGAAFYGLNFRLMRSRLAQQTTASAARSGEGSILAQAQAPTDLRVSAEGRLANFLSSQLVQSAGDTPNLGQIQVLAQPVGSSGRPLMVVKVTGQRVEWTPFYAKAALNVEVSYATYGDLSFADQQITRFTTSSGQPVAQYKANYDLADISWGIISYPGYHQYLAIQIAQTVLAGWQAQIKD